MNFSRINYQSFLGKILRLPLRLIPKGMILPILQGRLRGKKWIAGAGEHGYWLGSYELNKRLAFEREIFRGAVVYDIGANVGFFSLLASVLAGPDGRVYAFEPLPRNVEFLHKHVALNNMQNVEVFQAAVADQAGEALFDFGSSTAMGHLADSGELKVRLVSLDDMLESGTIQPPDFIKVDVEGAEYEVFQGASTLMKTRRPVVFLDTHQREAHRPTIHFLQDLGYRFQVLDGKELAETKELIAFPG